MKALGQIITILAAASLLAVVLLIGLFIHPSYRSLHLPLSRWTRFRLWMQDIVCPPGRGLF
jgi:hypothetical protein